MSWTGRSQKSGVRSQKPRGATWAAVALALVSVLAQVANFIRADLTPLRNTLEEINSKLTRIEQRLEDHERRLRSLESSRER